MFCQPFRRADTFSIMSSASFGLRAKDAALWRAKSRSASGPSSEIQVVSSRAFSIGPPHGEQFDFAELGADRLVIDGRGNERCFCPERFEWSKHLPGVIRSLPGDRICFFTGHENWLSFEILNSDGAIQIYEVFFNLTRQSRNFLRVYVESGYVRTAGDEVRRPHDFRRKSKVRGKVLLAKKLRNEPIVRPRDR